MKQIARILSLPLLLIAGTSGTSLAKGPETAPPEPPRYTPPPATVQKVSPPVKPIPAARPEKDCSDPETGAYLSGLTGMGIPGTCTMSLGADHDMDRAPLLYGAVGYNFGTVRLEGSLGYQKHHFSDNEEDVALSTGMINAYYDFNKGSDLRPFIMVGIGSAIVDMYWTPDEEMVFAWQAGAGLGYKVAKRLTLDLEYRYLKPSEFETFGRGDGSVDAHNILIGLRYQL